MGDYSKMFPNVVLGEGAIIGDYVVLGEAPNGAMPGELPLLIGKECLIRSHTVIYSGNTIGDRFQTGHQVMIREKNTIGSNVSVGTKSTIEHHVTISDNVRIHSHVFIPEYSVLGTGCWIGPGVIFTNAKYPAAKRTKEFLKGPTIQDGARIGAGSVLLPGVVVGCDALVGAGSVVVKDVPPGKVVVGNPARVIDDVSDLEHPDGDSVYLQVRR